MGTPAQLGVRRAVRHELCVQRQQRARPRRLTRPQRLERARRERQAGSL